MTKICMIVIYNHNYEANIERIEKLYKGKFDDIFHLIPFYTGNRENVIKVYGCAYQFNEYFMQGASKFVKDNYSHYVFVADDMILNPEFNQDNILQNLKLDENSGFFDDYKVVNYETVFNWDWAFTSLRPMFFNKNGCEYQNFIPSQEDAQKSFEKHGLSSKNITQTNLEKIQKLFVKDANDYYRYDYSFAFKKGLNSNLSRLFLAILRKFRLFPFNKSPKTSDTFRKIFKTAGYEYISTKMSNSEKGDYIYPLACGYSDFFVIPHKKINEFLHICSVFGSARVFVEVAIPTAMVLTLDKIVSSAEVDYNPGLIEESFAIENKYSIKKLKENWDKNTLFCHPVKLSKWKEDYE